jgi:hypothetical protein
MDFRNKKSATSKSNARKSARKTAMTFVKLNEVEGGGYKIEDGAMWLKSGKYDAPSVSIKVDPEELLSDWMRKIVLRNVVLTVEENEQGYSELIISGQSEADDAGDLPF